MISKCKLTGPCEVQYVVGVAPCCGCGTVLWVWHRVVGVAPYCGCGTMLWVWHHVVGVAPYCGCGTVL